MASSMRAPCVSRHVLLKEEHARWYFEPRICIFRVFSSPFGPVRLPSHCERTSNCIFLLTPRQFCIIISLFVHLVRVVLGCVGSHTQVVDSTKQGDGGTHLQMTY